MEWFVSEFIQNRVAFIFRLHIHQYVIRQKFTFLFAVVVRIKDLKMQNLLLQNWEVKA